jgi:hypothetical protein
MANGIGVTSGVLSWDFQRSYVERVMDNAAYEAAHPDDTLLLAGPPRFASVGNGQASTGIGSLLAMGLMQNITFTSTKPTQPMMMIGSGRSFFVSGKSQTSWNIGRLFCNGRNLLRVLYHNAIAASQSLDVSQFDDPAAIAQQSNFFINLDSELFYIPFGICAFFRNKVHELVGSFYAELCMINSYTLGVTAGQSMILENVSGLCDRLLPASLSQVATGYVGRSGVPKATIDALLDFASNLPADANPDFSPNAPAPFVEDDTIA